MVREFHEAFGLAIGGSLRDHALVNLRARLHREEFAEVQQETATLSIDAEALCKELCDLLYVVYGTGTAFGFDLDGALAEVHRSNMSKLAEDGTPFYRHDGKVLKSSNYFEPDMSPFVPHTVDGTVDNA
jgi:predicted HAD superfamily Cof-like phosphohydrolase